MIETQDDILEALLPPHEPTVFPPTWETEPAMPRAVSDLVSAHVAQTLAVLNVEAKLRFLETSEASLFDRYPEILQVIRDTIKLCEQARLPRKLH